MATSPFYVSTGEGNGDGMATSPFYLKEHSDAITTSPLYLHGRWVGHPFHFIYRGRWDGHLSILSTGDWLVHLAISIVSTISYICLYIDVVSTVYTTQSDLN